MQLLWQCGLLGSTAECRLHLSGLLCCYRDNEDYEFEDFRRGEILSFVGWFVFSLLNIVMKLCEGFMKIIVTAKC